MTGNSMSLYFSVDFSLFSLPSAAVIMSWLWWWHHRWHCSKCNGQSWLSQWCCSQFTSACNSVQMCSVVRRMLSVLPPTFASQRDGCAMAKWTAGKEMMKWDVVSIMGVSFMWPAWWVWQSCDRHGGCVSHVTCTMGVSFMWPAWWVWQSCGLEDGCGIFLPVYLLTPLTIIQGTYSLSLKPPVA